MAILTVPEAFVTVADGLVVASLLLWPLVVQTGSDVGSTGRCQGRCGCSSGVVSPKAGASLGPGRGLVHLCFPNGVPCHALTSLNGQCR